MTLRVENFLWRFTSPIFNNKALINDLEKGVALTPKALIPEEVVSKSKKKFTRSQFETVGSVQIKYRVFSEALEKDDTPFFNVNVNVPDSDLEINIDGIENYELNSEGIILRTTDLNDPNINIKMMLSGNETEGSWGDFTIIVRRFKDGCRSQYEVLNTVTLNMEKQS